MNLIFLTTKKAGNNKHLLPQTSPFVPNPIRNWAPLFNNTDITILLKQIFYIYYLRYSIRNSQL